MMEIVWKILLIGIYFTYLAAAEDLKEDTLSKKAGYDNYLLTSNYPSDVTNEEVQPYYIATEDFITFPKQTVAERKDQMYASETNFNDYYSDYEPSYYGPAYSVPASRPKPQPSKYEEKFLYDTSGDDDDNDSYGNSNDGLLLDLLENSFTLFGVLIVPVLVGFALISLFTALQAPAMLANPIATVVGGRRKRSSDTEMSTLDMISEKVSNAVDWYIKNYPKEEAAPTS